MAIKKNSEEVEKLKGEVEKLTEEIRDLTEQLKVSNAISQSRSISLVAKDETIHNIYLANQALKGKLAEKKGEIKEIGTAMVKLHARAAITLSDLDDVCGKYGMRLVTKRVIV
jgi:predicted RNase H-like nuclease (RuvC/YqgF family)